MEFNWRCVSFYFFHISTIVGSFFFFIQLVFHSQNLIISWLSVMRKNTGVSFWMYGYSFCLYTLEWSNVETTCTHLKISEILLGTLKYSCLLESYNILKHSYAYCHAAAALLAFRIRFVLWSLMLILQALQNCWYCYIGGNKNIQIPNSTSIKFLKNRSIRAELNIWLGYPIL